LDLLLPRARLPDLDGSGFNRIGSSGLTMALPIVTQRPIL
jgi:hypothetical protein